MSSRSEGNYDPHLILDTDDLPDIDGDFEEQEFSPTYEDDGNDLQMDINEQEEVLEDESLDLDDGEISFLEKDETEGSNIQRLTIKRPGATVHRPPKVYVQSTQFKVSGGTDVVAKRTMSMAEARRIGVLPANAKLQAISQPNRIILKKGPLGNLVSIKAPQTRLIPSSQLLLTKPVTTNINSPIAFSTLRTAHVPIRTGQLVTASPTTTSGSPRTIALRTIEGKTTQPILVRSGGTPVKLPIKGQVQCIKLVKNVAGMTKGTLIRATSQNSNKTLPIAPTPSPKVVIPKTAVTIQGGKRIILNQPAKTIIATTKAPEAMTTKSISSEDATILVVEKKSSESLPESDSSSSIEQEQHLDDVYDDENGEKENLAERTATPGEILEANGIRPKKPCNCTKSQCLKLYCECFAGGEFCYQCNCTNCFNNIEHEEERQQSILCCLDRNPLAFRPKFPVHADDDDSERQPEKGCNCKRSGCLKNYCECFEVRRHCTALCKCTGCQNTDTNRGPEHVSELSSLLDAVENSTGQGLAANKFLSPGLASALCQCILAQIEVSEKKGERHEDTERRIIEEFGQCLVQIIGNRSKKEVKKVDN